MIITYLTRNRVKKSKLEYEIISVRRLCLCLCRASLFRKNSNTKVIFLSRT